MLQYYHLEYHRLIYILSQNLFCTIIEREILKILKNNIIYVCKKIVEKSLFQRKKEKNQNKLTKMKKNYYLYITRCGSYNVNYV